MRKPELCAIEYHGYNSPRESEEIDFEILGLKHLVKKAEERMAMLRQSQFLANLAISNESKTLDDYFIDEGLIHDSDNGGKKEVQ